MKKIIFLLIVSTLSNFAFGQINELLISEYIEGSGYNKALEIFNGTGRTIDLSDYSLKKDINGNNEFSVEFMLPGLLANGEVYVVAHPQSSDLIQEHADIVNWGICNFNGDDQVMLCKNGTEIDRIGISGDVNFALDKTFIRTPEIWAPVSGEQDPNTNGQWIRKAINYLSDLGEHNYKVEYTNASLLFISEYIEGSYDNKALEIFNGTGTSVDLSEYSLKKDINGNNIFSESLVLSGTLADDNVYVVAHTESNQEVNNQANILDYQICNFNGDDQIMLCKNGMEIDRIGISGDVNFGERKTFIRTPEITDPVSGEQDPNTNGQWIIKSVDYFSNLGSHNFNPNNQELLLISEYIEGSAYNNALEIFNPTENTIDLSTYSLKKDIDGNNVFSVVLPLSGMLSSGSVYVIAHPESDLEIQAEADILNQQICEFSGSDQVILCKNNIEVDHFGIDGGIVFAADVAFVRNPEITIPATGIQDPRSNGEWFIQDASDFSNLGNTNCTFFPSNENYIVSTTIKVEGVFNSTDIEELPIKDKQVSIGYFDGLGRSMQIINLNASPTQKDIVQDIIYDDFGRQALQYLPFTISGNYGAFVSDATAQSESFHETENCYTETKFDESPLNKITEQIPQGDVWKTDNKSVKINYLTNTINEVIKWNVVDNICMKDAGIHYTASTLYVTETEDENHHFTREYKDGFGNVLMTASKNGIDWLKTYYVYDDFNLLRFVIPPQASYEIEENNKTFEDVDELFCYSYKYDERKRMIKKKLPGADSVYMVYDKRDLLIMSQDGNMRTNYNWLFTKYDAFKRPIISGVFVDDGSHNTQAAMQDLYNEYSDIGWETYNIETNAYSNDAFPMLNDAIYDFEIYSETYYDSYDYAESIGIEYAADAQYDETVSDRVKGMITTSKTKILDHHNEIEPWYLYTVNYYDKYSRVIQTVADNHKGGKDIISNNYNFASELLETKHIHNIAGSSDFKIENRYIYDHAGRLLKVQEDFNETGLITTAESVYNEKGELITKKMHSTDKTKFLQTIDYKYNIRGWMTNINEPTELGPDYFAMQLKYADAGVTEKQYNGNISAIDWNSTKKAGLKTYNFTYDSINRLTDALYSDTHSRDYTSSYDYDYNGNIDTLNRNGQTDEITDSYGAIDDLTYTYTGNQLISVEDIDDPVHDANGFINNNKDTVDYDYDANGNMVKDENKNIVNIKYNHLNLPEQLEVAPNGPHFIRYTYDAAGIKLRKTIDDNAKFTDYVGSYIYENGDLKFILTDYGKISVSDVGVYTRHYNLTDHLGNTRVTFTENNEIIQEDSYYPFGMTMNGLSFPEMPDEENKNLYLYNGKELQSGEFEDFSLDWYDYGARFYDAQLGRFHTQDAYAEKYYTLSPYQYGANNPINVIDINGDSLWIQNSWGRSFRYEDGKVFTKKGKDVSHKAFRKNGKAKSNYIGTVAGALGEIMSEKTGGIMVGSLQDSKFNYTIKQNTSQSQGFRPGTESDPMQNINNANAFYIHESGNLTLDYKKFDNIGSGGFIVFNPGNDVLINTGNGIVTENPTITLGHELFHAWDSGRGLLNVREVVHINGGTDYVSEIRAMYFGNKLRDHLKLGYYRMYRNVSGGGKLIDNNGNLINHSAPSITFPIKTP